jgi:glycosyltransferase involved in cell wall biosynthesis
MVEKKKIHIVGTHGVPAKYGGFETLADHLCRHLAKEFDITVYCNANLYPEKRKEYFGAKLSYVGLNASGFSGIFYDIITYTKALASADVILYLSPVGSGFIIPLKKIFGKKVIVNHGGLNEWEREKLNPFKQKWAKFNHLSAARFADINIADNELYSQSLKANFNANSKVIRYGGDHVETIAADTTDLLEKYPFVKEKYAASVSRAQIDNNLHTVLEAFTNFDKFKLVLISNWNVSDYGRTLKQKYSEHPNMILLDAIYDTRELDYIRGNSFIYIHSHSRCGTAPSLVEAMSLGQAVLSFDVPANRETTQGKALYFDSTESLISQLNRLNDENTDALKSGLRAIALEKYSWDKISSDYKALFN